MLRRNPEQLANQSFDLLVVGGGINGAAIAWEAVLRGLSVALVERGDYGSGSTAGNFRTLHGGLRYLQHLDLPRLFESVREQNYFLRAAPHLTRPLPFLVPCSGLGMKSKSILSFGLSLYEFLARMRNVKVDPARFLPKHELLSVDETLRHAPFLPRQGLSGGVLFYDAQMTQPDRLTLAFLQSAAAAGVVAANYLSAKSMKRTDEGLIVTLLDRESGAEFTTRAAAVVNATGPWSEKTAAALLGKRHTKNFLFSKGLQLLFPNRTVDCAVAVQSSYADKTAVVSRGSRSYFLMPWRGKTIAGTADIVHREDPEDYQLTKEEGVRFVEELKSAYPDERLTDPELLFGGLRPVEPAVKTRLAKDGDYGSVEAAHRDRIFSHEAHGVPELISVIGIKYTTARAVAEKAVDLVAKKLKRTIEPSTSLAVPLFGGNIPDLATFTIQSAERLAPFVHFGEQLALDYGSITDSLIRECEADRMAGFELCPGLTRGQLYLAIATESAIHLPDVIFRRTSAGTARRLTVAELRVVAQEMGRVLNWNAARCDAEIQLCEQEFGVQL